MSDEELDEMLLAARDRAPAPTDALMMRIMADAERFRPKPRPLRWPSWLSGWAIPAGLAAATAGFLIGVADPAISVGQDEMIEYTLLDRSWLDTETE